MIVLAKSIEQEMAREIRRAAGAHGNSGIYESMLSIVSTSKGQEGEATHLDSPIPQPRRRRVPPVNTIISTVMSPPYTSSFPNTGTDQV